MDQVLQLSLGLFAGLSVSISLVGVPAILSCNDPLPSWRTTYNNGSKIALPSLITSTILAIVRYFATYDHNYLICAAITFSVPVYTLTFIKPVNDQLFAINNSKDKQVIPLINKWNRLQWIRTITGLIAFVFYLVQIQSK